jgi:hypothetical protein
MNLMDLNEQADKDFGRARRRAFLRRLARRFRDDALPAFEDVRKSLRAYNRVRVGTRVVDLGRIVGSVGRRNDFDRSFMPLRAWGRGGNGSTWRTSGPKTCRRSNCTRSGTPTSSRMATTASP